MSVNDDLFDDTFVLVLFFSFPMVSSTMSTCFNVLVWGILRTLFK